MIKPTVFCDVCGKQKAGVNHWLIASHDDGRLGWVRGNAGVYSGASLLIAQWNDEAALLKEVVHLCGAECVQKKVNEFLGTK